MKEGLAEFCDEMIKRRKMLGLTQTDVSLFLGLSRATLTNIEKGRQVPNFLAGLKLLSLYGMDFKEYFEFDLSMENLKKLKVKFYRRKLKELKSQR